MRLHDAAESIHAPPKHWPQAAGPEMDGVQVLERLAKDLRLRALPVIVTSAGESMDSVTSKILCP